ncbi:MAG: HD-GYP domain-containing protein, partial [Thermoanaerobaculia bacterium]
RLVMQQHPVIGGATLDRDIESFPGHTFLSMAATIAYQHHERWDGSGYPRGLAGDQIALAARIVALADAYDAITAQRPYEDARSHAEAVERITQDDGTHFDPQVVDAFLHCERDFDRIRRGSPVSGRATGSGLTPDLLKWPLPRPSGLSIGRPERAAAES